MIGTPPWAHGRVSRGSQFALSRDRVLPISPSAEEGGGFGQLLFQVLHLAGALKGGLLGFITLLLGASQECLERFDGRTSEVLGLQLPLRLGGLLAGLGLCG